MATTVPPTADPQDPYYTTFVTRTYPFIYEAEPTQYPSTPGDSSHDGNPWDNMGTGIKSAIAMMTCLAILAIVILSAWYCCGCCGLRQKRRERRRKIKEATNPNPRHLELSEIQERQRGGIVASALGVRDVPPPRYDEVVPPQHQIVAGGITHVRDEEQGVISDGKMPLSEMAFEDVVLDHSPSEGSARTFQERHYRAGGDTTGHTNV